MNEALRQDIADIIGIDLNHHKSNIDYKVLKVIQEDGYVRKKIEFDSNGDKVPAFLLIPERMDNTPAVLINHQHNSERHFGKSEVCGLVGSPFQAFGPALVKQGFVVLVPDIICFEERRKYAHGLEPLENDKDFWNHLNEMCYRVLSGDLLMKKILEDTMTAITLLSEIPGVDKNRLGTLGHSMGGNTVQFLAAMDKRISFACASGSACSYKNKMKNNVGMELSIVVPNLYRKYDVQDLLACIAPRRLLIVSADDDKYSRDASDVVDEARKTYAQKNAKDNITHVRYQGGHALSHERFEYIVNWIITNA